MQYEHFSDTVQCVHDVVVSCFRFLAKAAASKSVDSRNSRNRRFKRSMFKFVTFVCLCPVCVLCYTWGHTAALGVCILQ